ncbi:MAG: prepilin-type N-terminal cleavage/methylation domain-containing protein [Victivallaceae bacterium]|nr:prepilin-type N-terminal cleavage/methylation domain-containing protein [Victivallaceae bacterium]
MDCHFFSSRGRFTLVELLVVIGIIGILSAMLMPALGRAKMVAQSTDCKSNIRQLVAGNLLYADTFHGYLAPYASDMMGANKHRWHGTSEEPSNSGGASYDTSNGLLAEFIGGSGQINRCASFIAPDAMQAFEKGCGGYGYNTLVGTLAENWSPEAYASGCKIGLINATERKVMFADSSIPIGKGGGWGNDLLGYSSSIEAPGGYWLMFPTMHFRHLGKANIGYCDGHVGESPLISSHENYDVLWNLGHPCENNDEMRDRYYRPRTK